MEIHRRTGIKPKVIVSNDYWNVFEGVSYAEPVMIRAHWYGGMPVARAMAEELGGGIVPQFWHDHAPLEPELSGAFVLQSHGKDWGVNLEAAPDYGTSMWRRAGFSREEMMNLPLVFDRRNPQREQQLVAQIQGMNKLRKPLLLYNFTGISSPFGYTPEVMNVLRPLNQRYYLVDLGRLKAHRIYDLLGLLDAAELLVTTDTATLHLAPASKTRYVAYTVDGWSQSVPKGNCVWQCKYSQAKERLNEFQAVLSPIHDLAPVH